MLEDGVTRVTPCQFRPSGDPDGPMGVVLQLASGALVQCVLAPSAHPSPDDVGVAALVPLPYSFPEPCQWMGVMPVTGPHIRSDGGLGLGAGAGTGAGAASSPGMRWWSPVQRVHPWVWECLLVCFHEEPRGLSVWCLGRGVGSHVCVPVCVWGAECLSW
jgi:hypothetical protein